MGTVHYYLINAMMKRDEKRAFLSLIELFFASFIENIWDQVILDKAIKWALSMKNLILPIINFGKFIIHTFMLLTLMIRGKCSRLMLWCVKILDKLFIEVLLFLTSSQCIHSLSLVKIQLWFCDNIKVKLNGCSTLR